MEVNSLLDRVNLGNNMLLVGVDPAYEYDPTGAKTDHVNGYKYTVVLPELGYEKLTVKVAGPKAFDYDGKVIPVSFEGLELRAFSPEGKRTVYVSAKAQAIISNED